MTKRSGFEALLDSFTKVPDTAMAVLKGWGNFGKNIGKKGSGAASGATGFIGSILDTGARQVSRTLNAGHWMIEKWPVLATLTGVVLFWKPIKNTFKKMFGMKDPEVQAYQNEIKTLRSQNPYMAGEVGPRQGMPSGYWQNYVKSTRGQMPEQGGNF